MKTFLRCTVLLALLAMAVPGSAVEIKYAFKRGYSYNYTYKQQSSARATAFTTAANRSHTVPATNFSIKTIDFQDGAFILDIGNKDATFRRYVKANGDIKGAPAETWQNNPFFLVFPDGDWKISGTHQTQKNLVFGGRSIPAAWNLLLKSVDTEKGTAEILFSANLKLPDDRLRQKTFSLKGRLIFNLLEGVIHQADWQTIYTFNFANKEFAVTRNLWGFTRQIDHSLIMTGIEEQSQ